MTRTRHVPAHHDTWRGLWRESRQMHLDGTAPPIITLRWAALLTCLAGVGFMAYAVTAANSTLFTVALTLAVAGLGALTGEVIPQWADRQNSSNASGPPASKPSSSTVPSTKTSSRTPNFTSSGSLPSLTHVPSRYGNGTTPPSSPPWELPDGGGYRQRATD